VRGPALRVACSRTVGLDIADLAVPDKWVPATAVASLLERSAQQSGMEDFGLRLASLRRLSTLGPLSVVLRQEPDLRSALRLLAQYEHSYNEAMRLRLEESIDLASMRLWLANASVSAPPNGGQVPFGRRPADHDGRWMPASRG
jgi:hypothetical protein